MRIFLLSLFIFCMTNTALAQYSALDKIFAQLIEEPKNCYSIPQKNISLLINAKGDRFSKDLRFYIQKNHCGISNSTDKSEKKQPLKRIKESTFTKLLLDQPEKAKTAKRQIELFKGGGNAYVPSFVTPLTIARFLHDQKVDYTNTVNNYLSEKLGVSFSAETFQESIYIYPKNRRALDIFENAFRKFQSGSSAVTARADPIRVANSLFLPSGNNPYVVIHNGHGGRDKDLIIKTIQNAIGENPDIKMLLLKRHPTGDIDENVKIILPQIIDLLSKGHDIYFISLSKGSQEILRAVIEIQSRFSKEVGSQNYPQGWGQIKANLSVSALFSGSVIADYAELHSKTPKIIKVLNVIHTGLKGFFGDTSDFIYGYFNNGRNLTTDKIENYQKSHESQYPTDIVNVSVSFSPLNGVVTKVLAYPVGFLLQRGLRNFRILTAANDNFIALPGSQFPFARPKSYELFTSASHALFDGEIIVENIHYSLSSTEVARIYFKALLFTTFKLVEDRKI